jgi:hypothetical protein
MIKTILSRGTHHPLSPEDEIRRGGERKEKEGKAMKGCVFLI